MSDQPSLFPQRVEIACTRPVHTMHRTTDTDTSRLAATQALPRMTTNRWLALRAIVDAGAKGLDDFALARVVGVKQTSIGVRRKELVNLDLVEALVLDGKPVRRLNEYGSLCQVWHATAAGVEAVWAEGL